MSITTPVSNRPAGRLHGRTAVVTGAAAGIGRAYAVRLAQDGAQVGVLDLADGAETVAEIETGGGVACAVSVDLADPVAVEAAADSLREQLGPVEILVNNAGMYPHVPFAELDIDIWRRTFAVNVEGIFSTMKAFTPDMQEGGWGRVINISSNSIGMVAPNLTHYIASKMAVIGLTRGAATELAPYGITVNSVGPSLIRTANPSVPDVLFDLVPQMQAIKRPMVADDIVGMVSFLASDDAAFITAQNFWVDGGAARGL